MERGVLDHSGIGATHGGEQPSYLASVTIKLLTDRGDQIAPLTSHVNAPQNEPRQQYGS
jgi:hypothetical protein